jgi:nucleotide-binding universal stress UspA family protein
MGALDVALQLSKAFGPSEGAELTVLHVVPKALDSADVVLDRMAVTAEVGRVISARHQAESDTADLSVQVKWADSASGEILRFAQEENVDLIVIGTHGYGAVKRALIGGVAAGVARAARQPVLLVPPALWKDGAE